MSVSKIISGGQTGADRAALDWAIAHGIPHGGWCPKGRIAEDGVIDARYLLTEVPNGTYRQRTRANVRDSDGTLIITLSNSLVGGSEHTALYAQQIGKPCLHVWPGADWLRVTTGWLRTNSIGTMNVAGPRASGAAGIEVFVKQVLDGVNL